MCGKNEKALFCQFVFSYLWSKMVSSDVMLSNSDSLLLVRKQYDTRGGNDDGYDCRVGCHGGCY